MSKKKPTSRLILATVALGINQGLCPNYLSNYVILFINKSFAPSPQNAPNKI